MNNHIEKTKILLEALPYIKKFNNKIIVVKYGGNAMLDDNFKKLVATDIVLLRFVGIKVVVVHGGGPEISATLKQLNIESKFVDGLRVTDEQTADVVGMVLAGKLNKEIVSYINNAGGTAVGLSGVDGKMLEVEPIDLEKYGYVGKVTKVDPKLINEVLDMGRIPVVAGIASDDEGYFYNINADTTAGAIAGALKADKFILMSDVPGILRSYPDPDSLIHSVRLSEIEQLKKGNIISGGMLPKVDCCTEALNAGAYMAHIIDGRIEHSLLLELFTDAGIGTEITK